jgi:DNA-binding NtrC family response regulator
MTDQKRLLILDDDAEVLELMSRILSKKYQLLTKINTDNLEEEIQSFQPDAILIDHFIGDKTSNEIISHSLRNLTHIPVILHSAHEDIERLSNDENVAGYIRKPSSITEIRDCIHRVITSASTP